MNPTADLPVVIRPAAPADLHAVVSIRQAQELADSGLSSTTAEGLAADWEALGPRLSENVWVAEAADGRLVACAQLVRVAQIFNPCLWVLPEYRDIALAVALLVTAELRACEIGSGEGVDNVKLFAQATSTHPAAQQALAQSGYVVTSTYEQMELVLDGPPTKPDVIAGIEIRPFAVGQDTEAIYRADEEAFLDERGHAPRTFERWNQRLNLRAETSDPPVWLIAWDTDEIAGAALGEVIERVGWIHHLGVRRPWRRRGLGAALMLAALDAFYRLDIDAVRLNVDAQSLTNAHQLYRRLGFRVIGAYSNCEKIVPLT